MLLTPDLAKRVERARAVLDEPHDYEPADMAARIGKLQWHLGELLALVGELSGAE